MKTRRTSHTIYQLAYHFVWIPKYRLRILSEEIGKRLKEMLYEISVEYEWEIEALEVMEDHVHMFVSCAPRYSPAQVMNIVKSLTARTIFEEYPQIRKKLWGGKIWADGYYVGSSGEHVTSELIRRYIEYQKQENQGPQQMKLFDLPLTNPKKSKHR